MTATPVAWEIPGSTGGTVTVRREGPDLLVTWLCGGTYAFTREILTQAIAHAEDLAPLDVWLRVHDADDDTFVVKVVNGRLVAAESAFTLEPESVEWDELRELLQPTPTAPAGPWAPLSWWQRLLAHLRR